MRDLHPSVRRVGARHGNPHLNRNLLLPSFPLFSMDREFLVICGRFRAVVATREDAIEIARDACSDEKEPATVERHGIVVWKVNPKR